MIIEVLLQLKMWYNDLDKDHRRTLNKYVSANRITQHERLAGTD